MTVATLLLTPDDAERLALATNDGSPHAVAEEPDRRGRHEDVRRAHGQPDDVARSGPVRQVISRPAADGDTCQPPPAPARIRSKQFAARSARRRSSSEPFSRLKRLAPAGALAVAGILAAARRPPRPGAADAAPAGSTTPCHGAGPERVRAHHCHRRPFAGADDAVRHHAHRDHESEVADAMVVCAARVAHRRQVARNDQPDHLGRRTRVQYDLEVDPGITALQSSSCRRCSLAKISSQRVGRRRAPVGARVDQRIMLRAAEIARPARRTSRSINLLQLPGGKTSQQVMLQVRFAEVNRIALEDLGSTFVTTRVDFTSRTTTEQFARRRRRRQRRHDLQRLLNLFFFSRTSGIGGVIKALEQKGNFQSLAEPNLIAYNGQEASFLAGGEFPVPIVSGNGSVTCQCVQGVRRPAEVQADDRRRHRFGCTCGPKSARSTSTTASRCRASGFPRSRARRDRSRTARRPVVRHRRPAEQRAQNNNQEIPFISQIPIIGNFFKSRVEERAAHRIDGPDYAEAREAADSDEVPPLPPMPMIKGNFCGGGDLGSKLKGGGGLLDAPSQAPLFSSFYPAPKKPGGGGGQ